MRKGILVMAALALAAPVFGQAWSEDFNGGGAFPWAQVDLIDGGSLAVGWDYNYNLIDGTDPRGNFSSGDGGAAHMDTDIREGTTSGLYDKILWSPSFVVPSDAMLKCVANYIDRSGDSFSVVITTDAGTTWADLAVYTEDVGTFPPSPYSEDAPLGDDIELDISAYATETAQIGFRYAGDGWNWWAQVDNVVVTPEPASLALLALAGVLIRRR